MPHIAISMYPGRSREEKAALAEKVRTLVSEELKKDPKVVTVSVHDVPAEKWQEHLDTIKSEMFGDFLQGLNSLEYSATQFEYFSDGSTSYDLPKILQGISLQDIIKLGRQFIDQAEMVDYMIFQK